MWNLTTWVNRNDSYDEENFQHQPAFIYLIDENNLDEIIKNISQKKLSFLINFLPESLQQLYYYSMISSTRLSLIMFLSQCLLHFEQFNNIDENIYLALLLLYPLLKEYKLENYALILFKENYSDYTSFLKRNDGEFLQAIEDRALLDPFLNDQSNNFEILINLERQRIHQEKHPIQNQEKDMQLFAATISFARLLQAQYRSRNIIIDSTDSKEVHIAIMNILNPILRIMALSIILDMKDPLIFNEEQRDQLRSEMIIQLESLLPQVSLLTGTTLFIRCYKVYDQYHRLSYQQLVHIIAEKFHDYSNNKQNKNSEAVFIALKQLNDCDLSHCLSEYVKQNENLSDLLEFKSTIFFRYFLNLTSFDSSNNILLSLMYLLELIFDSQILRMFIQDNQKDKILPMKEFKQLWNELSKKEKIMTHTIARWITNNFQILNKQDQDLIIEDVSKCLRIERKALVVIEKWLDYQTDTILNFFSDYAALQLFIGGSNIPGLIDIINKMFAIDAKFHLESIIENLISSELVNSNIVRQILIALHKNLNRSSKFSVSISCKKMFELFLNLELERITSNVHGSSKKSFLSMISHCSVNLEFYLVKHFRSYLNFEFQSENTIKDEYFACIVKWMNNKLAEFDRVDYNADEFRIELYTYIFTLPDNERYPLVHKEILDALNLKYISFSTDVTIFLHDDIIIYLERMIYSWYTYSENVLADCLLTYGNCLVKLRESKISRNVSSIMKDSLLILSERSLSEVISIRANFCLIFIEHSNITSITISNWFENKLNMTSEKRYKILLQRTLYKTGDSSRLAFVNEIVHQLETHCTEFLDFFVVDLYNYLCSTTDSRYLSNSIPNYIGLAAEFRAEKWNEFQNAVQRSSFGEEKFKRGLYFCCKNNPNLCQPFINIYVSFGIITNEFIEMCEEFGDNLFFGLEFNLDMKYLKVFDRHVIDTLFEGLFLKIYDKKFRTCLWILRCLAKNHIISLLEVHQRIRFFNNVSSGDGKQYMTNEKYIFDLLLEISCFHEGVLSTFEKLLFNKSEIEEEFDKIIDIIDKQLILCVRRNQFE